MKNAMKDTTKEDAAQSNTPLRRSSRKKTPVKLAGAEECEAHMDTRSRCTPNRRSKRLVGEAKKLMEQWG